MVQCLCWMEIRVVSRSRGKLLGCGGGCRSSSRGMGGVRRGFAVAPSVPRLSSQQLGALRVGIGGFVTTVVAVPAPPPRTPYWRRGGFAFGLVDRSSSYWCECSWFHRFTIGVRTRRGHIAHLVRASFPSRSPRAVFFRRDWNKRIGPYSTVESLASTNCSSQVGSNRCDDVVGHRHNVTRCIIAASRSNANTFLGE